MRYILADIAKAAEAGFTTRDHRTRNGGVILNEKEVMTAPALLGETIEARTEELGGILYTHAEIMNLLKQRPDNE